MVSKGITTPLRIFQKRVDMKSQRIDDGIAGLHTFKSQHQIRAGQQDCIGLLGLHHLCPGRDQNVGLFRGANTFFCNLHIHLADIVLA